MQSNEAVPTFESFAATVVTYEDDPDLCTISPIDVDDELRSTRWVTAEEGSYIALDSCQ